MLLVPADLLGPEQRKVDKNGSANPLRLSIITRKISFNAVVKDDGTFLNVFKLIIQHCPFLALDGSIGRLFICIIRWNLRKKFHLSQNKTFESLVITNVCCFLINYSFLCIKFQFIHLWTAVGKLANRNSLWPTKVFFQLTPIFGAQSRPVDP